MTGESVGDTEILIDQLRQDIGDFLNQTNNYLPLVCVHYKNFLDASEPELEDARTRAAIIHEALGENGISDEDREKFWLLIRNLHGLTLENYDFVNGVFETLKKLFTELQTGVYGGRTFTNKELGLTV